jgi:hypothetical protein
VASPIFGVKIPAGYRDWKLISVAHEAGKLDDLRANLGNDVAIKAYREDKASFPDGAIIARPAWNQFAQFSDGKPTANLRTRRCTRPASAATSAPRTTSSSPITRLDGATSVGLRAARLHEGAWLPGQRLPIGAVPEGAMALDGEDRRLIARIDLQLLALLALLVGQQQLRSRQG